MNNSNQNSQEVDILQFFKALGKMFTAMFAAISGVFKFIFYRFLDLLILVKKHYLYFGTAVLAGLILSFVLYQKQSDLYKAQVQVRTNYNSQVALQEKIDLYNDLIQKEDNETLAEELKVTTEIAGHFKGFELEPIINDVFLINDYENYLMQMDTVVYKYIKYKDYKKNINNNENLINYWKITVYSDQADVFKHLNKTLNHLFDDNSEIQQKADNYLGSLKLSKQKILKSINDIDTLRSVLNKAMLQLSTNPSEGSGVMVTSEKLRGPEGPYNLFIERTRLLNQLTTITHKENNYSNALVMLNAFPVQGIKTTSVLQNTHFLYPLYGFLLVLLILWAIRFNDYLSAYQKEKELQ